MCGEAAVADGEGPPIKFPRTSGRDKLRLTGRETGKKKKKISLLPTHMSSGHDPYLNVTKTHARQRARPSSEQEPRTQPWRCLCSEQLLRVCACSPGSQSPVESLINIHGVMLYLPAALVARFGVCPEH